MSERTWEEIEREIRDDYLRVDGPENVQFREVQWDVWLAEERARTLEESANDLRVSFSRGAAIAMHHQCHKKQCRCGNPGNDEIVRAVFEAAREELRARAEAYRQERKEQ